MSIVVSSAVVSLSTFQRRTLRSTLAVARRLPSGENETDDTGPSHSSTDFPTSFSGRTYQSFATRSAEPADASSSPSGEKTRPKIVFSCALIEVLGDG